MVGFRSINVSLNSNGFISEVMVFSESGNSISTDKTMEHTEEELPTCTAYISQHEEIIKLLELYKALIRKDTDDLIKLNDTLHELDLGISTVFMN